MTGSRTCLLIAGLALVATSSCRRSESKSKSADAAPADPCEKARVDYMAATGRLDRACGADADCAVSDLDYNPCDRSHAVRRGAVDVATAQEIRALRQAAWTACGFVVPPCVAMRSEPRCVEGRCQGTGRWGRAGP